MTTDTVMPLHFTGPGAVSIPEADAVLHEAGVAAADVGSVQLSGPGAVECAQGIVTADLVKPGPSGFSYGATLTPKGMIVTDLWIAREGALLTLHAPRAAGETLGQLLARSLPPRMARAVDRTEDLQVLRLVGPLALGRMAQLGVEIPEPGQTVPARLGDLDCIVAHPGPVSPFALQIVLPRERTLEAVATLERAGIASVRPDALDLARVVAGWPRFGAEIDQKTLPQEVRFDEHGGVSYTKGCYTGQETVARLHFRGHANRWLGGLSWTEPPQQEDHRIVFEGKLAGRVSSVAWLPRGERWIGLGLVRREVGAGQDVVAAGARAMTSGLPFELST